MSADLIERLRDAGNWQKVDVWALCDEAADALAAKDTALSEMRAELERLRKVERAGILLANAAYNIHQLQQHVTSDQMDSLKSAQMDFDAARALASRDES